MSATRSATAPVSEDMQVTLEEELRSAQEDFTRGDFLELTSEELDRWVAAGVWPWPDESSG